jgi:hypothetical protein
MYPSQISETIWTAVRIRRLAIKRMTISLRRNLNKAELIKQKCPRNATVAGTFY